jgi:hypothetical protein
VSVNEYVVVLETATFVGGATNVVAETEFESADAYIWFVNDRIVIDEYVVPEARPVTVTGLDVTPVFTETPLEYTA